MKEGRGKSQAPAQRGATCRAAAHTVKQQPTGRHAHYLLHKAAQRKDGPSRQRFEGGASLAAHKGPQPQAAGRAYLVCHYVGQHAVVTALVWRRPDGEEDDRADYSHALHGSTERLNVREFEGGF